MVEERFKSLIIAELVKRRIVEDLTISTILCRPLPCLCVLCCLFWTQISEAGIRMKGVSLCNLLRIKRKLVFAFDMVAATKNFRAFAILSNSLRFSTRHVLLIVDTIWPHENGVNPSVESFSISSSSQKIGENPCEARRWRREILANAQRRELVTQIHNHGRLAVIKRHDGQRRVMMLDTVWRNRPGLSDLFSAIVGINNKL